MNRIASLFLGEVHTLVSLIDALISGDWFQSINLMCFRTVHCMPKVPIQLLSSSPCMRGTTQESLIHYSVYTTIKTVKGDERENYKF